MREKLCKVVGKSPVAAATSMSRNPNALIYATLFLPAEKRSSRAARSTGILLDYRKYEECHRKQFPRAGLPELFVFSVWVGIG